MGIATTWKIITLIILLFLSAFFSASETALMSLSKIKIRNMVNKKISGADIVHKLLDDSDKLLGSILVGNNIVNIGASALATSLSIEYFGDNGVGIATGIMTFLVLVFGEITPKSLAIQNSEKVSIKVAKPIYIITTVLSPVVRLLMYFTNIIIKIFGGEIDKKEEFITEEELKTIVSVSHEEGVLEREEKQMIYNIVEFGDSQTKDVMTPRMNMIAVDIEWSFEQIVKIFEEKQFSRLPVYEETIDNIIGILNIKELFFLYLKEEDFIINQCIREPFFTYEFVQTTELFNKMRSNRIHMAVVLDEYGGTAGIITLEDLVEEIVGDIHDEYDGEENEIEVIDKNEFIVHGSIKITEINGMIGIRIKNDDFDSLGGFLLGKFGRLPKKGEEIQYNNVRFIIEKVDKNRIEKIRIKM